MNKWESLKSYIIEELNKPFNNDDIPKSILEDILYNMEYIEKTVNDKPPLNIIDVMRLPVGTKLKSNVCDGKILKICMQENVKVLKFDGDFRRIFLDADITEAEYEIV